MKQINYTIRLGIKLFDYEKMYYTRIFTRNECLGVVGI